MSTFKKESSPSVPRRIQSVERALDIIDILAREPLGLPLSSLAERVGLPAQTAQSLLRTLQYHGWIAQNERGAPYCLGPALGAIYRKRHDSLDPARAVAPALQALSRELGEYVVVAEWSRGNLQPLAEARPDRELIVRGESFDPRRLHRMATGKLLMAFLPARERTRLAESLSYDGGGPRAASSPAILLRQLRDIKERGYALCVDESTLGVVAIAVPIPEPAAESPQSALGISMPGARFAKTELPRILSALHTAAAAIATLRLP